MKYCKASAQQCLAFIILKILNKICLIKSSFLSFHSFIDYKMILRHESLLSTALIKKLSL